MARSFRGGPAFGLVAALGVVLILAGAGGGASGGLVAAWGFDETSGATTADLSGNGNTGTISGATRAAAGRFGGALSFDGSNDSVNVADSASLDLTAGMTLEAWVRPNTLGTKWRTLLAKEQAGRLAYALYANRNTGRPWAEIYAGGAVRGLAGTGQLPIGQWTHLAVTYDGATLRLYVNGTPVASTAYPGSIVVSTGLLRIGGNSIWGEWFEGLIDEVRVYNRALAVDEIQRDLATSVGSPDSTPPSTPSALSVTAARSSLATTWNASTDDLAVAGYSVYRDAAKVATTADTAHTFSPVNCSTGYQLGVEAFDAAGNVSTRATLSASTLACDTSPPHVSLSAPAVGATVAGTVGVAADAFDDDGIAGVQFTLDGNPLGSEDVQPPYALDWNTRTSPKGAHVLGATARDPSGNRADAAAIGVNVDNGDAPPPGLVAAYAFEDGLGSSIADSSGKANVGTLSGPAWTTAGRFRSALSFDGVNDRINVPDASSLDVTAGATVEAWVFPTALGTGWRTVAGKERSGGVVYVLYANRNTGVPAAQVYAGGAVRTVNGTARLPLNTWSHLALTYDGTTLRLYVNGTLSASAPGGGAIAASTGLLRIGGNSIWGEWLAGRIDEVRVYDRALSEAELRSDMDVAIPSAPSMPSLTLVETEDDEHVSSQTIYYRPRTGGSGRFVVSGSSTDADTGIAKLAFPPVFGVDGGDDAVAPYEAAYVWADAATASGTKTVTAVNRAGLTSSSTFTVTPDMSAPSSGSITYADGYDGDGLVPLTRANGTDGLSGVDAASARVERQTATLAGGACGGFGAFGPAGSPDALATALCARYRARVSDNVGNEAVYTSTRVARVDLSPPVVALLAPAELTGGADQHYDTPSRTHYFRPTGGGSFSLGASSADAESGASPRFPDLSALTGWTGAGGSGSTYAWAAGAAEPGERQVVGTNGAGLSSAVSLTIAADSAPPAGGSIAYAGGYDADGTITVATTTGMDVGAGLDLASAALERQTAALAEGSCGELGAWQPVSSPDPVASGACARYRFRASDHVRNEGIHVGEIVKVDLTDPTDPALTLSESDPGGHVRDSTLYYRPGTSGNFAVAADSADPESGIGRALFPEVFGGDSGVDSEAPFEATYAWTSATTASGNPAVSMENGAGLASSAEVVVQPDGLAPEGGSVDYPEGDLEEGTPVTVSTEAGIDAGAGLDVASGVLERQTALGELGACSEFGPWEAASSPDTVVSGTCARYRYRVSDHVGNEAVYTSAKVVEVGIADTTPPDPPTLTVTETEPDEHVVGSTIFYNGSRGNAGSFTVSAEASDPESGIAQVIFPDVFGLDGASDTQPPYEREYSWNDRSTALGSFPVTVENRTGLTSSELFSVVRDEDGPDEVWVAYSGGYEAVPIVVETDVGFDLGAGLEPGSERLQRNSAPFGAGACGTFEDAWIDIVLVGGLDPSVLSDTCYRYRHSVSDKIGNVTTFMPKDVVKIDVTPPTPPTDVSVTATTETSVTVSWSPASDNGRVGGYALGRLGTTIANTWTTEYTFRNLACGMSYGVAVRAMDLARQFSEPVTLDVTTASCTVTPPPADVFLSPAGVDTNPCTAAEPCLTLGRGYRAAQPGQAVELASGLYAGQHSVLPDPTKTADTEVHFRPAPGAVAEIESLDVFGKHVSFSDLLVTRDFYVKCGAEDVTFRHSKAGIFFVTSASDVSLVDSEFGPYANGHSHIQQDGDPGCSRTSTNVLIDGVYFHDDYTVPHDSKHMECLTVQTAVGLTIRNSRFHRCEDFDVLFKKVENAADHRDVLIENTWFDEPYPDGTTTIQFSAPDSGATYTNVVLRHNSFGSQAILKPGFATFVDMRFLANVGTDASCLPSVRYDLNVWSDGGCGATDTVASMDYVDQAGFDFHLAPGAAAVNHGDPMDYPATDIDDEPRADGQPDAGADERQ